jgi:polysaccharide biosynthesis transport protein
MKHTRFVFRPVSDEQELHLDLGRIARFFARNWRVIAAFVLASLVAAVLVIAVSPSKYTAAAQIFINPPRERTLGPEGGLAESPLDPAALESEILLIQSAALLEQVAKTHELVKDPEFNLLIDESGFAHFWKLLQINEPTPAENEQDGVLLQLRRKLSVDRIGKSYVLKVSITTSQAAISARLANAIAEAFIMDRISVWSGSNSRALRLIDPAVQPSSPSQPKKLRIVAAGVILGFVLGVAACLLVEAITARNPMEPYLSNYGKEQRRKRRGESG